MSSAKSYPSPLIVPPLDTNNHTHTLIHLHGRGSNGERFGNVFLETTGIAQHLPTVKFIFPTARKRRSTALKRIPINQWFDNYSLEDPDIRTDLQIEGLEESCRYLRGLIDEEAQILSQTGDPGSNDGYERVVIGGLSQGCATSIFCLLSGYTGDGPRLGGFVGMSGWLPFENDIAGLLDPGAGDGDDNLFFEGGDNHRDVPPTIQALNHIRDILDLPELDHGAIHGDGDDKQDDGPVAPRPPVAYLETPVFLGHGSTDPKVSVSLGEKMAFILSSGFGMDVTWRAYKEFGHWYKVPDEIDDVVKFLKGKVGIPRE